MTLDLQNGNVYVAECAGDKIKIFSTSNKFSDFLSRNSYLFEPFPNVYRKFLSEKEFEGSYYVKNVKDDAEKAKELEALRDAGIPFSGGKEWNPQEVFEYLRDKGMISGSYIAIGWHGLGSLPGITER